MGMKTAIIAIAKNEAAYLSEWIAHHLYFGFDEFHVWINGTNDNSRQILEKIGSKIDGLFVYEGDELLAQCIAEDRVFQLAAYSITLEALRQRDITHVMCLDLDEYWTSLSLRMEIKDILANNDADVVAFMWHIDLAEYGSKSFSLPIEGKVPLIKNAHVKSVAKLSERLVACGAHSHVVTDGSYCLPDGLAFPTSPRDGHSYGTLAAEYVASKPSCPEFAFVLHRMNRSPLEYLASLQRGRAHALDNSLFKINRHGFVTQSSRRIIMTTEAKALESYELFHREFVDACDLAQDIEVARQGVLERARQVLEIVRGDDEVERKYRKIFRGINLSSPMERPDPQSAARFQIEEVENVDGVVIVVGWAFNKMGAVKAPGVYIVGVPFDYAMVATSRPEIMQQYELETDMCGFRISIGYGGQTPVTKDDIELCF